MRVSIMDPKISVIVPVYNVEQYVEKCVESISRQTYHNLEIILVDDGSKDNSGILCDELKRRDNRIIVIHQDNGGLPAARNSGLRIASGEFIIFIDSDDWIDSRMIEILLKRIIETDSDIAVCNAQTFNRSGMDNSLNGRYSDEIIDYSDNTSLKFYYSALDACWNHMYRASLIMDNKINFVSKDVVAQEDFFFQVKVYTFAKRVVTIAEKLYKYRERGSSISKKGQSKDFSEKCLRFVHYTEDFISDHSSRKCNDFYDYQFLNMLMASINNVTVNTVMSISNTIRLYRNDKHYKHAINSAGVKYLYPTSSIQHKYYRSILWLIRHNCITMAAMLEQKRISRLRSNTRTDLYFT